MPDQTELIPHLFRTEYRKISSVLCRLFGIGHIEIAEDIASETFLSAMETWPYKGIPENPSAWLYAVAKNKAKNHLNRHNFFRSNVSAQIHPTGNEEIEIDLSEKNITDSQLQMLFALCHPSITVESQIALSLRLLCGFGIDEIANAFLTNKETVNKRLYRAKEKLRIEKVPIELPSKSEINRRLETVLATLYLLFNEGYYSESRESIMREDLCVEAMRLNYLLIENELTNKPIANALFALMCFHSSRFPARKSNKGEMILYEDQDETKWNQELITKGIFHLREASVENKVSKYHLEASIAYWHTIKADAMEKWESILHLYNLLLQMQYSPVAALNRTYAVAKVKGKQEAIMEAEKLALSDNHYYFVLLGELYTGIDNDKARSSLQQALILAKRNSEKKTIEARLSGLN